MKTVRSWGRMLLWFHLFVCVVWLAFVRAVHGEPVELPDWTIHVVIWSIVAIQFSWGYTIGLLVGPRRSRRNLLWWSLLTIFLPLWPIGNLIFVMGLVCGPLIAAIYILAFTVMLGCETFCGVLLGVKSHSLDSGSGE